MNLKEPYYAICNSVKQGKNDNEKIVNLGPEESLEVRVKNSTLAITKDGMHAVRFFVNRIESGVAYGYVSNFENGAVYREVPLDSLANKTLVKPYKTQKQVTDKTPKKSSLKLDKDHYAICNSVEKGIFSNERIIKVGHQDSRELRVNINSLGLTADGSVAVRFYVSNLQKGICQGYAYNCQDGFPSGARTLPLDSIVNPKDILPYQDNLENKENKTNP